MRAYLLRLYRQLHAAKLLAAASDLAIPTRAERLMRWIEKRYRLRPC